MPYNGNNLYKGSLAKANADYSLIISWSSRRFFLFPEACMMLVFNPDVLTKSMNIPEIESEESFDDYIQKSESDSKLEHYKKLVLEHLSKLEERENKTVAKSIAIEEYIQKANFPIGTIRTWNGVKFRKIATNKWRRIYESDSRGARQSLAYVKKQVRNAKDFKELGEIISQNSRRFMVDGKMLPFVQEILNEAKNRQSELSGNTTSQKKESEQKIESKPVKEEPKKQEEPTKNDTFTLDDIRHIGDGKTTKKVTDMEVAKDVIKQIAEKYGATEKGRKELGDFIALNIGGTNPLYEKLYKEFNITYEDLDMDSDACHDLMLNESLKKDTKKQREQIADSKDKFENNYREMLENEEKNFKKEEQKKSGKKKGLDAIRDKYQSSKSIDGDEDEIYIGKESIPGKFKLVEADAPSASHDEITFHKTEGFPTDENGGTVNDRDYEHDTAAQETVLDIAADFDGRALAFDSPVVVTQDGVVISGNNRTMSSKIAAKKGTDTKYLEALKKRAKKFGFSVEDVEKFKHPRVVFETEQKGDYTTREFAKFNESGKKAMNPVEKAVKVSKTIKADTIEDIASTIGQYDTMGELYADSKACNGIFNTLINGGIIQKTDLPQYFSDDTVTAAGKEFLETVLIGSVIDESNIRSLNTEGGKSIRQKLVRAITPLIENKGMKGYSINKELNDAVSIAVEVSKNHDKFPDIETFAKQQDMFRKLDPVAIELAKKLEGTQKGFAEFMQTMNGGLRPAANGESDIFFGGIESKEDIVSRILNLKNTVKKALDRFFSILGATA